jgi:autoinducer 2-degrading protein
VFYEVYDDRAAFDAHLQTPHFFRWRDATQGLITDSRISYQHRRR